MKKLTSTLVILSSLILNAADFEATLREGSRTNLSDKDAWKGGDGLPSVNDNVKILPHKFTENYSFYLDFPEGGNSYGFKNFVLDVERSLGITILLNSGTLEISGDLVKNAMTVEEDGRTVGLGEHAGFSMSPYYGDAKLNFRVKGNMILRDNAVNRTASTYFGAYTGNGEFRNKSFFETFEVCGDLELLNQNFAVATMDGRNAEIKGQVKFGTIAPGRTGVLILNNDRQPEGRLKEQHLKVGGLVSLAPGAGIVSTRTGAKKLADLKPGDIQNPADPIGKKLVGDDTIRAGTIEITGKGGEFSGEISDNLTLADKRGKLGVIMNSPEGKQILSGKLSYSGPTVLKAGELILNGNTAIGDLKIAGGILGFIGETLTVGDLSWSSGGFAIDFAKNRGVTVTGDMSVSVIPEALDTFTFSNITPRKSYAIFSFENKKNALTTFMGKKIEYKDAATGKMYDAIFGTSDTALTVVFMPK